MEEISLANFKTCFCFLIRRDHFSNCIAHENDWCCFLIRFRSIAVVMDALSLIIN